MDQDGAVSRPRSSSSKKRVQVFFEGGPPFVAERLTRHHHRPEVGLEGLQVELEALLAELVRLLSKESSTPSGSISARTWSSVPHSGGG